MTLGLHREIVGSRGFFGWMGNWPFSFLISKKPLPSCGIWEVGGTVRTWWPLRDSATVSPLLTLQRLEQQPDLGDCARRLPGPPVPELAVSSSAKAL